LALLTTIRFAEPFHESIVSARHTAEPDDLINGGNILIQMVRAEQRSAALYLGHGTMQPTLDAVPTELSLCLLKKKFDDVLESDALDR
jgi:uncharacterized FAD-dependent dehydrogenase